MTSPCQLLRFAILTFFLLDISTITHADCCHPKNCKEWLNKGFTVSGVYVIQPLQMSCSRISVYCDMTTEDGGWTVFQRRLDGSEDFYRSWWLYERGFGSAAGEYWLGLAYIHAITVDSPQELRVDMSDFEGNHTYAKYRQFSVADDIAGYRMTVGGYSGKAGDAMAVHNESKFSTWDHDQDTWPNNCASKFHGAWWYSNCHDSNPNGKYLGGPYTSYADGVVWQYFRGNNYSLKTIEFKTRPL